MSLKDKDNSTNEIDDQVSDHVPELSMPVVTQRAWPSKGGRPILETVEIHGPDSASTVGAESSSHTDIRCVPIPGQA